MYFFKSDNKVKIIHSHTAKNFKSLNSHKNGIKKLLPTQLLNKNPINYKFP